MKASELRIGNFVDLYGKIATIQRADFSGNGVAIHSGKPIPLTEEWLMKFGFEKEVKIGNKSEFRVYRLHGFTYNTSHGWWFGWQLGHQPKYVHQLQNLYFALTGEELEIVNP